VARNQFFYKPLKRSFHRSCTHNENSAIFSKTFPAEFGVKRTSILLWIYQNNAYIYMKALRTIV